MAVDVYYDELYGKLYETSNVEYVKYVYESSLGRVIHRFLKRGIDLSLDGKTYYDLVTPYGYGGPIVEGLNLTDDQKETLIKDFGQAFEIYCKNEGVVSEFV